MKKYPQLVLSPEQRLIVLCCCTRPASEQMDTIGKLLDQALDWNCILSTAAMHGLSGLLYSNLRNYRAGGREARGSMERLKAEYHAIAYRNVLFSRAYKHILKTFNNEHIKVMPFKGIAFIHDIYHNIALRPFTDIDIIIEKSSLVRAEQALQALGYHKKKMSASKLKRHFHSIFWQKQGEMTTFVELHWDIDFADSPYRIQISDFWQRAQRSDAGTQTVYSMSLEDSIIANCFHIIRGDCPGQLMPLKNFCDLSEIITRHHSQINWQTLTDRSEQYRVTRPVYLVLFLLEELFRAPVPIDVISELKNSGLRDDMTATIYQKRIFPKKRRDISMPRSFLDLSSSRRFTDKIAVYFTMVKKIYRSFRNLYYYNLDHSILTASRVSLSALSRSFLNYVRLLYFMLLKPEQIETTRNKALQAKRDLEEIELWMRGAV